MYYLGNTKARIENMDLHFPFLVQISDWPMGYWYYYPTILAVVDWWQVL